MTKYSIGHPSGFSCIASAVFITSWPIRPVGESWLDNAVLPGSSREICVCALRAEFEDHLLPFQGRSGRGMEENPRAAKKGSSQLFCDRSKGGERRQQECRAENGERENGTETAHKAKT